MDPQNTETAEKKKIYPVDLYSLDSGFTPEAHAFSWAWSTRINGGTSFRVLTIEEFDGHVHSDRKNLLAVNLKTKLHDYYTEAGGHYFNWRWFKDDSGNDIKVITIEDFTEDTVDQHTEGSFDVHDLKWTGKGHESHDFEFNWRWYRRGKTAEFYKVVTLE